jgi:hypothetical protein
MPLNVKHHFTFPKLNGKCCFVKREAPPHMKREAPLPPNPMNEPYEEPYDSLRHTTAFEVRKKEAHQERKKAKCR